LDSLEICPSLLNLELFDGSLELAFEKLSIDEDHQDPALPEPLGELGGFDVGHAFEEDEFGVDDDSVDDALEAMPEGEEDEGIAREGTQHDERRLMFAFNEDPDTMYSYFDSSLVKNWAGPEHWKRIAPKGTPLPFLIILFSLNPIPFSPR
jgi:condensin complex subunit 2